MRQIDESRSPAEESTVTRLATMRQMAVMILGILVASQHVSSGDVSERQVGPLETEDIFSLFPEHHWTDSDGNNGDFERW